MLASIRQTFRTLRQDQRGLTTVEYAIVLCLIAAVSVGAWNKFGDVIKTSLGASSEAIENELTGN